MSGLSVQDLPMGATLIRDEDAPLLFAIWFNGDIIGAGHTEAEALAEADATVAVWIETEAAQQ